ncbi:MAG: hypothetical protein MUO40_01215, partial [Anaerolineaceae bacterium]|nr:hypothetical protein [Anaerolineaceae bacterium]
ATHLNLYADPYYTVLPGSGEANIIAVIKDSNGNTKIDWNGGDIHFTILGSGYSDFPKLPVGSIGSELGDLESGVDEISITPNEGRADITFHASGYEISEDVPAQGDVVIEASVDLPNGGGTISDTITITVTLDVVRIELSADYYSIDADGESISTVTAALKNSGDITVDDATNNITFIISGEGTFVNSEGVALPNTVLVTPPYNPGGMTTIDVKSSNTPGVATVTAISEGLLSDTVNITTTGNATSISVSIYPDLIYTDDTVGARVTVEIQDINGIPVEYGEDISLTISGGTGTFEDNPVGPASAYSTFFHPTSSGLIIITASGGSLAEGSATIDVQDPLIADTISLSAIPKNILAGGDDDSKITATVKQGSTVISNYSNPITFKIISDTSSPPSASLFYNFFNYGTGPLTVPGGDVDKGEVMVYLMPSSDVGICTIEVSTNNLVDLEPIVNTVKVGFYSIEDHIELKAFPSKMLVEGDICTVMATVVDEGGIPVVNYSEDITFTILVGWPKNVKFAATGTSSLTTTLTGGDIDIYLIPQKEAGTVTLKASSFTGMTNITGYLNIQVISALTDLELALEPHISFVGNQVSFDINVQGTEISLVEMQVSWDVGNPVETLDKIDIAGVTIYNNDPSDLVGSIVYTDNLNERVADINVAADTILSTDIYTITMYFDTDMSGKTFGVIFNPNSGNYTVEINEPAIE